MPEGHTIHRIARDHDRNFAGQTLKVSSPQGRFAEGSQLLSGKRLKFVTAHGKHLCYVFTGANYCTFTSAYTESSDSTKFRRQSRAVRFGCG